MRRSLLIAVSPGEAWAALCEDDAPVELAIARSGGGARVGAICLGRVVALNPALPAALVDIGEARPGFLSAEDARPGTGIAGLSEGEAVVVQVLKEARADKATGLTLRLRLEGVWLELRPGRPGSDAPALAGIAPMDEGFALRDPAAHASPEVLAADAAALRARWQAIEAMQGRVRPPARLEPEETPAVALLARFAALAPSRIVVDDRAAFAEALAWLRRHRPGLEPALERHAGAQSLFEAEDAAAAIAAALEPRGMLPGGGALTIEATAAAVMIDVDSRGAAFGTTNIAAARVAARQIRLRNLAGPIVIDFIAMRRPRDRDAVRAALAAALADDPAGPQLLGWTRLGHMELVRPRRGAALDEILREPSADGGRIKTALTVALEALRALAREADAAPGRRLRLRVAPEVAAALEHGAAAAARQSFEARFGRAVLVAADPGRARESFDIGPA